VEKGVEKAEKRSIKMGEHVERVTVSKKGRSVTAVYPDGHRMSISYEEFLNAFKDPYKAELEYLAQIWYILGTYTDLGREKVEEIVATVRKRLESEA
jgi:hypothetical protein